MKYPLTLRLLHWLMALIILAVIGMGFYMADLPRDAADKFELYPIHKALGFIALLLIFLRIAVRLTTQVPKPPSGFKPWEILLSRAVHFLLYAAMLGMALSGYLMSSLSARSDGLSLFGLVTVPDFLGKSDFWGGIFHQMHGLGAYVIAAAIALHLAGVIKHRFLDAPENDVLQRMI